MNVEKEIRKIQIALLDLNEEIKKLTKDSHPPVINKEELNILTDDIKEMKVFFDNIYEITLNKEKNNGMVN